MFSIKLALLWGWLFTTSLLAQESSEPAASPADMPPAATVATTKTEPLSVADLDARLKQLQSAETLEPTLKASLLDHLQKAIDEAKRRDTSIQQATAYRQRLAQIAENLKTTRAQLEALPSKTQVDATKFRNLDEIVKRLAELQDRLENPESGLRKLAANLEAEAGQRGTRLKEIPEQMTSIQGLLDDAKKQLEMPPPADEPSFLTQVRKVQLQMRREMYEQRLAALQAESQWWESTDAVTLLREQRDLLTRQIALVMEEGQQLAVQRDELRKQEAAEQVYQAQREAALAHPLLKPLAEENQKLAEQNHQMAEANRIASQEVETAKTQLDAIQKESDRIESMVEAVGLTESIGLLLRRQRSNLPDPRQIEAEIQARAEKVPASRLQLFELDQQMADLADVTTSVQKAVEELKLNDSVLNRETFRQEAEEILKRKRELVAELHQNANRQFDLLVQLDSAQRSLVEAVRDAQNYIDERVLWIRTGGWLGLAEFRSAVNGAQHLLSNSDWQPLWTALQNDPFEHPATYGFFAVVVVILFGMRRWARRRLWDAGDRAAEGTCREFSPTVEALLLTLFLGAWPAFGWFLAWRLDEQAQITTLAPSLAFAIREVTAFIILFEMLRVASTRRGLFQLHFNWPTGLLRNVHARTRNLLFLATPGVLLTGFLAVLDEGPEIDSLGRIVFILLMVTLNVYAVQIMRRPATAKTQDPDERWAARWWQIGALLAMVTPGVLILMAIAGYYYSALRLSIRVHETVGLCLLIIVTHAMVVRWIALQRKSLAIKQARERRALAESELKLDRGPSEATEDRRGWGVLTFDLGTVIGQVRRLLDVTLLTCLIAGFVWIWADVVPALGVFNQWELWTTTIERSSEVVTSEGETKLETVSLARPITATDLGLSILLVVLMLVAARNVPGLMKVALLERLPLDVGMRDAFSLFVRYGIVIIGMITAFSQIGVEWSKVQWLVAAASVGLGFGLQEIFANFVSGIILLFERPLRVGDVVTIGDVTGAVARIQFRATTIKDWDCKELIVPNKELVTGKLVNWTLSDKVNRLEFRVGVAYDSDPHQVREILLKIAAEYPHVLKDPAPHSVMDGFGGSTLQFVLRVYLPALDLRLQTIHDIHSNIAKEFAEHGIKIAFPQLDVHVRKSDDKRHEKNGELDEQDTLNQAGILLSQ